MAHDKTMMYNILMERSKKLEEENSSLVLENETYQRQYEKSIDEISKQVVQALLTQKVRTVISLTYCLCTYWWIVLTRGVRVCVVNVGTAGAMSAATGEAGRFGAREHGVQRGGEAGPTSLVRLASSLVVQARAQPRSNRLAIGRQREEYARSAPLLETGQRCLAGAPTDTCQRLSS